MRRRTKNRILIGCAVTVLLVGGIVIQLPAIGAALILHPFRRPVGVSAPAGCVEVTIQSEDIKLRAWRSYAVGDRKGTLIYLHGHSDNRASGSGIITRFRDLGFDVLAYDSRAHGDSGGSMMTYGYLEKQDLRKVIDNLEPGPVVLLGSSLGAAVALQLAGEDPRVSAVVAAETFSDLRTIVTERAPFFFPDWAIDAGIARAEIKGNFDIGSVSPEMAAAGIKVPVLLLHGAEDSDTPPVHSERVFQRLGGPKDLMLVPGAGHNQSLQGDIWPDIEQWITNALFAD
jgi:uncharacterized protein